MNKNSRQIGNINIENNNGKIAQFVIEDENITSFQRSIKKDNDCVINALEILRILDGRSADIARIFVGDIGVNGKQIEQVFNMIQNSHTWTFESVTNNINDVAHFANNVLKPQHSIFCGYHNVDEFGNSNKHVFIIAKTTDGTVLYIDPQVNAICDLNANSRCQEYLRHKNQYWMLRGKKK